MGSTLCFQDSVFSVLWYQHGAGEHFAACQAAEDVVVARQERAQRYERIFSFHKGVVGYHAGAYSACCELPGANLGQRHLRVGHQRLVAEVYA